MPGMTDVKYLAPAIFHRILERPYHLLYLGTRR